MSGVLNLGYDTSPMPIIELAGSFLFNIAKDAFHDWAKKEGTDLIDGLVKNEKISILGKHRAATNKLWESVSSQVEQPALIAAINLEASEYLKLPGLLCEHSDNLPEQPGSYPLKGLTALPRRAVNEAAMMRLKKGIGNAQLLQDSQEQSAMLVSYFLTDIVREFDKQYSKAYRGKTPLEIGEVRDTAGDWVVIALDSVYPWPSAGSLGHYLVYHDKLANFKNLGRTEKKNVEATLTKLEGKLGGLAPKDKDALVNSIVFRTETKYSSASIQWKMV